MKGKAFEGRIDAITFRDVCPLVFASENLKESGVWHTDLKFERGKHYLVEATSGAGKSSMCSYIFGSRIDYSGSLCFNNTDVRQFNVAVWQEIRREHLAYLPQDLDLFPELTAFENIMLKNRLTDCMTESRIEDMLRLLGISDRRDFVVGKMSVGQRQRVALIRSLCQPFDFLLLDEPVSHLDSGNNAIAARMVMEIALERKAGIITTSVGNHLQLDNPIKIKL